MIAQAVPQCGFLEGRIKQVMENILVVDDQTTLTSVLLHILEDDGYHVEVAHTAEEALKKFDETPFDLAIIDINLPGMSGLDLLERFKKIDSRILSIIITAYGSLDTAIKSMKLGAVDYITKPFKLSELQDSVKDALEKRSLQKNGF